MPQEINTVAVLGATGNLSPYIVPGLVTAGFKVTVLSRSQPGDKAAIPAGVKWVQSDYTSTSLVEAFKGQDAVVSTISTMNVKQQVTIIDAAVAAKVKRFIPSDFGSDSSVEDEAHVTGFLKDKQEVVKYLRTKEADGLSWTSLVTGPWVDWLLEEGHGLLGVDIRSKTATIIDSGNQEFTTSTMPLVTKATTSTLLRPEETKNRYVHVHSFTLTQNLLLEAVERVTGTEFAKEKTSREDLLARAAKHMEEGDYEHGYYETVNTVIYSGPPVSLFPERAARGKKLLGLVETEDLDEMVKGVLANIQKS
ncbi:NAD(P)-binding protein [Xylaria castorea]|nr:NAD(P)-binding protein [Xylaria castorea]